MEKPSNPYPSLCPVHKEAFASWSPSAPSFDSDSLHILFAFVYNGDDLRSTQHL